MAFPSLQDLDTMNVVGLLQLSVLCDSQSTWLPRHKQLSMPWEGGRNKEPQCSAPQPCCREPQAVLQAAQGCTQQGSQPWLCAAARQLKVLVNPVSIPALLEVGKLLQ